MKTMIRGALAGLTLAALTSGAALAEDKSLVTVVTSPDAQTQLMAMVLTVNAAQQGAVPHILLCGPAADMALKEAPESATAGQPPKNMSPQGLMKKVMGMPGAKVEVCAIYLPGKGATPDVLIEGVGVAQPPAMAKAIMDADDQMNF
ncbi:hypothetical protein [Rhodalgimonas zhirmunskyi]|uniref:DsrE/DsrF-like family protein n=1 Tax=Rhodalgimonas zhirmunskyi TaxID=2964767 RepID=A0AAJ1UB21_9RHOB|nr:hypothetical protein [Rhodoalgimonas zhirmunskyi]MDQ2092972.1 hypothetical protein [Rhodoalgimonas zhirmunskyi]